MVDNFDTTTQTAELYCEPTVYGEREYSDSVHAALTGLLETTDDSRLSFEDGRANSVQTQLMDALAYTAHKQIAFHQRMLDQDVYRYGKFLQTEYSAGNEISDIKMERFEEQIARHQVAVGIYEVFKKQAVALYLNVTGLAEWKPFDERKAAGNATPRDRVANAKLAELTKRFGPMKGPEEAATKTA